MKRNYESNQENFADLQDYIKQKLKPGCRIRYKPGYKSELITFNGDRASSLFEGKLSNDSVMANIGLNNNDLRRLKKLLRAVNCMSIDVLSEGEYELSYVRRGAGVYSYRMYAHPLSEIERDSLSMNCSLIIYNENVVFEYSPGATGSLCFPKCDKHISTKNRK